MISPQNPSQGLTPAYDPLASQFMTGGQMGYMPQAQFMTPSQYGAFRTMPGSDMSQMPMERPTAWQSYMTINRGRIPGGIGPDYLLNTWRQGVDQTLHRTMAMRRWQDAQSSAMGTMTDIAGPMALGGAVGGIPGAAVGMLAPSISGSYIDRIRQARRIQDQTMSKITVGPDMAAGLGQGFSAPAAQRIDEGIRGKAADDVLFKEEDYRELMRVGMEHGMFDYSSRTEEYKRIIKNLRNNANTMMELFGSTDFKELMGEMKRMLTMGADVTQMQGVGRQEHMFARMTGMRHDDMVSTYGQQGALTYSQHGLTNYQGSLAAMSNAAQLTMSQRLGLVDPSQVARQGGVSGWTQDITNQQAAIRKKLGNVLLPYAANDDFTGLDPERVEKLRSGEVDYFDAIKSAQIRRANNPEAFSRFLSNRAEMDKQFGDMVGSTGQEIVIMRQALALGKRMSPGASREDALRLGYMHLGYDDETAGLKSKQWSDPAQVEARLAQEKVELNRQTLNAREQSLAENTGINRVKRGTRKFWHGVIESTYGQFTEDKLAEKQFEENINVGVIQQYGSDPLQAGALGTFSDEEFLNYTDVGSEEAGRRLGHSGGILGFRTDKVLGLDEVTDKPDYTKMGKSGPLTQALYSTLTGSWQGVFGGSEKRADKFRNIEAGLAATRTSEAARRKGFKKYSDDFSMGAIKSTIEENISSVDDLQSGNIEQVLYEAIRKSNPDMEDEDARARAKELAGSDAKNLVLGEAFTEDQLLQARASRLWEEEGVPELKKSYDDRYESRKKLSNRLSDLTSSTFMGMFDHTEDTETLKKSVGKDLRSLQVLSAQALLTKYYSGDTSAEERKTIKKLLHKKLVGKLGLSEKQFQRVLKSGNLSTVSTTLTKTTLLEDEDIKGLTEAGIRKGEDLGSMEQVQMFLKDVQDQGKDWGRFSFYQTKNIIQDKLKEAGLSFDDLEDSKISELLKDENVKSDKELTGVLRAARSLKEDDTQTLDMQSLVRKSYGLISAADRKSILGVQEKPGSEDITTVARNTIDSLDDIAVTINSTNKELITTLNRVNTTLKEMNR